MNETTSPVDVQVDDLFAGEVDADNVAAAVAAVLAMHELSQATLTVVIADDTTVRELNRTYRGIDAATDVLSFASRAGEDDDPPAIVPAELAAELNAYLGDIVIAFPYAARQAACFDNTVAAELRLLAVHGTLHLLGYDHATPEEEAIMWAQQDAILQALGDPALAHRDYPA